MYNINILGLSELGEQEKKNSCQACKYKIFVKEENVSDICPPYLLLEVIDAGSATAYKDVPLKVKPWGGRWWDLLGSLLSSSKTSRVLAS